MIRNNTMENQVEDNLIQRVHSNAPPPAYIVDLQQLHKSYHAELFLTEKELSTYQSFSNSKRKLHWLGGRVAAKKAVMSLIQKQLQWHQVEINAMDSGRPFASIQGSALDHDVAISHSGKLAGAFVVSRGYCGIDIQIVDKKVNRVTRRFCTGKEFSFLKKSITGTRNEQLTLLWAAKESIRKAAGIEIVPGFMEIKLTEISTINNWYTMNFYLSGNQTIISHVRKHKGYGLALTRSK